MILNEMLSRYYFNNDVKAISGKFMNINSKNFIIISKDKKYFLKSILNWNDNTLKKINIFDKCHKKGVKTSEIIRNKEDKLITIHNNILYILFIFYDGKFCRFTYDEIYSAGENLAHINNELQKIDCVIERDDVYNNLSIDEIDKIKRKTNNKKIINLCNRLNEYYDKFDRKETKQNVYLDYNTKNVLFLNNKVEVILDFDSIITSLKHQSIAFACDRFSKNIDNIKTFLLGYKSLDDDFCENLIPLYIEKETIHRINYILRSSLLLDNHVWNFELNRHLKILENTEKLKWT